MRDRRLLWQTRSPLTWRQLCRSGATTRRRCARGSRGRTGFPLVDAGMRQLWATGWMQQSIRMVCAAFLTEYLNLHWVHGCRCGDRWLLGLNPV